MFSKDCFSKKVLSCIIEEDGIISAENMTLFFRQKKKDIWYYTSVKKTKMIFSRENAI